MNWMAADDTAYISVDVTNSFTPPDGSLKVEGALEDISVMNELRNHFRTRILTKERHRKGSQYLESGQPDKEILSQVQTSFGEQTLWPDHSLENTDGEMFHDDLIVKPTDIVFIKGIDPDIHAYSALRLDDRKTLIKYVLRMDGDAPNTTYFSVPMNEVVTAAQKDKLQTMAEILRERAIKKAVVDGEAYDFCAGLTACDLALEGFEVYFVRNASHSICLPSPSGVAGRTTIDDMDEMLEHVGVKVVNAADLPRALGVTTSHRPTGFEVGPA